MPNWIDQVKLDMMFATKMLLEEGSVTPMFILHQRNGEIQAVVTPFSSDHEKDVMAKFIVALHHQHPCFAQERKTDDIKCHAHDIHDETIAQMNERARNLRPSESPDRVEVITVTTVYRGDADDRWSISAMAEILRDQAETVTGTRSLDTPQEPLQENSGRIPNILPAKPPSELQQAAAKLVLSRLSNSK